MTFREIQSVLVSAKDQVNRAHEALPKRYVTLEQAANVDVLNMLSRLGEASRYIDAVLKEIHIIVHTPRNRDG